MSGSWRALNSPSLGLDLGKSNHLPCLWPRIHEVSLPHALCPVRSIYSHLDPILQAFSRLFSVVTLCSSGRHITGGDSEAIHDIYTMLYNNQKLCVGVRAVEIKVNYQPSGDNLEIVDRGVGFVKGHSYQLLAQYKNSYMLEVQFITPHYPDLYVKETDESPSATTTTSSTAASASSSSSSSSIATTTSAASSASTASPHAPKASTTSTT